jgi:hypothetical protein
MMPLHNDRLDFLLDSDNELVIDRDFAFASGQSGAAQVIRNEMEAFKGEWFLDLDDGTPWYQEILGKKYNEVRISQVMRTRLLAISIVDSVIEMSSEWDGATRTMTVYWEVKTVFGDTVSDSLPVAA